MTVGAIIGLSFLSVIVIISVAALCYYYKKARLVSIIAGVLILAAAWSIGAWYYSGTEAGKRAMKTQESNFGGGIDDDRILFDDEDGLRHIIYYPTGNVIVDEVSKQA